MSDPSNNLNESIVDTEMNTNNEMEFTTPQRNIQVAEPSTPVRNNAQSENNNELDDSINEPIITPEINRISFNIQQLESISLTQLNECRIEYIHYCDNVDCEGDCGVLVCGCIDMCRGRCGTRNYDYYFD
jgi:hypothetical protein